MNTRLINKPAGIGKFLFMGILLLMAVATLHAQEGETLKGRVVDEMGEPISGAVVNVSESSRIALTDVDGFFSLTEVNQNDELYLTAVGYVETSVPVEFTDYFTVVMQTEVNDHTFTMPVPFAQKENRIITEATSVVTGDELKKHPITVLQNAFTSTVTGVSTYEWASEPGWTESAIYIRGLRTMNSSARAPLVIVDNVERDLSFLDAYPIENITILKDAASTAIYGMRGANGAIMVTTKRGQAGKTKIDFTQEFGYQTLSDKMEVQNSYNMAMTRNQVRYLSGNDPMYTSEQIEMYRKVSNGEQLEGID